MSLHLCDECTRPELTWRNFSHHPPVTACYLYNETHGISAEGYVAQETSFSPTSGVTVNQVGHAIVHLDKHDEHHMITLPTLNVKSILTGSPYPELSGTCHITSTSGYTSRISFEGKRILGAGKKNSCHAEVYRNDKPDEPIFEVRGQWNGSFTVHDCASEKDIETVDVNALEMTPLRVAPLDKQDPWESRRAWGHVIDGIEKKNVKIVSEEKNQIEEGQRHLRKQEQQEGAQWPRLFFRRRDEDAVASGLARAIGETLEVQRTDGIWRYVGREEADAKKPPFHEGCLPTGRTGS